MDEAKFSTSKEQFHNESTLNVDSIAKAIEL
jgi:hypothetical protein